MVLYWRLKRFYQDNGKWIVVRFEPKHYPFYVTDIQYALGDYVNPPPEATCRSYFDHKLQFYVGTTQKPSNNPNVVQTIQVPQSTPKKAGYGTCTILKQKLANPVELKKGEYLFVAIEARATADGKDMLCVNGTNFNSKTKDSTLYWLSNETTPPYTWLTTTFIGLGYDLCVEANGYYNP